MCELNTKYLQMQILNNTCINNTKILFKHHPMQEETVFLATSLAYGMYDKEYQVIASDCKTTNIITKSPFLAWKKKINKKM